MYYVLKFGLNRLLFKFLTTFVILLIIFMKVFDNIKDYFLNNHDDVSDFDNQFYIRNIGGENVQNYKASEEFYQPHKRDFFEIGVIVRHKKEMKIGGQNFKEMTNGLAIVSPFQTITYGKDNSNNQDEGYVLYFKSSILENLNQPCEVVNEFSFFKMHTLALYFLSEEDFEEVYLLADELYHEAKNEKLHSFEIIKSLLLVFLYKIKRITINNEGIVAVNRFEKIMSKFENAIHAGNYSLLSVQSCAEQLNISPIYLSECVKKVTGKSAQRILIDYKILQAKALLHQKGMTLDRLADTLGFNDVANFNQFFKRHTGITPTQFRKT